MRWAISAELLHHLGLWHLYRWWFDRRCSPVLRILSCHRVINLDTVDGPDERRALERGCLSLAEFEERIRFIVRHYRVVPLENSVKMHQQGHIPPRSVVLTFDDGFKDVHENVYPVLKNMALPFTVFPTTSLIGARADMLSYSQVRVMAADPLVSWGAHGVTHRALTDLSQLEAEQEILESRQAVESWTGKTVSFFAYPEGRTSPQLRAMLVKHGFSAACTTGREVNCGDFDLFELKRIPLTREPMSRFAFRLAGLSDNWRMSLKKRGKS